MALADYVSTPFMECVGIVQHRVELLDIERRRSAPVRCEDLRRSLAELRARVTGGATGVGMVKLVDQGFFCVDQLLDDLHKRCDLRGTRLVDLLKDLAVPKTFVVAVDDLVVPNADAGITVLEEPIGVLT
jgi:sulfur carrier protein ThiS